MGISTLIYLDYFTLCCSYTSRLLGLGERWSSRLSVFMFLSGCVCLSPASVTVLKALRLCFLVWSVWLGSFLNPSFLIIIYDWDGGGWEKLGYLDLVGFRSQRRREERRGGFYWCIWRFVAVVFLAALSLSFLVFKGDGILTHSLSLIKDPKTLLILRASVLWFAFLEGVFSCKNPLTQSPVSS